MLLAVKVLSHTICRKSRFPFHKKVYTVNEKKISKQKKCFCTPSAAWVDTARCCYKKVNIVSIQEHIMKSILERSPPQWKEPPTVYSRTHDEMYPRKVPPTVTCSSTYTMLYEVTICVYQAIYMVHVYYIPYKAWYTTYLLYKVTIYIYQAIQDCWLLNMLLYIYMCIYSIYSCMLRYIYIYVYILILCIYTLSGYLRLSPRADRQRDRPHGMCIIVVFCFWFYTYVHVHT